MSASNQHSTQEWTRVAPGFYRYGQGKAAIRLSRDVSGVWELLIPDPANPDQVAIQVFRSRVEAQESVK